MDDNSRYQDTKSRIENHEEKSNWSWLLPLLLLPLAFYIGWVSRPVEGNLGQIGLGGGPGSMVCMNPTP